MTFFIEIEKNCLDTQKKKKKPNSQSNKNRSKGTALPYFKVYYKTKIIFKKYCTGIKIDI